MTAVPPQAISAAALDAAVKANDEFYDQDLDIKFPADVMVRELAKRMLEAAAPHLAAPPSALVIQVADGAQIDEAEWNALGERLQAAMRADVTEAVAAERETTVDAMYAGAAKAVENAVTTERKRILLEATQRARSFDGHAVNVIALSDLADLLREAKP